MTNKCRPAPVGPCAFLTKRMGCEEKTSVIANNDPFFCPAKALARIVQRLRQHRAPPDSPIHSFWNPHKRAWDRVTNSHLTTALRWAAKSIEHRTGIPHMLLSSRSLRAGSATALLVAGVDVDVIQLLGRWLSDTALHHLRVQATTRQLSQAMPGAGECTFAPDALPLTPEEQAADDTVHILEQTPASIREALEHLALDD